MGSTHACRPRPSALKFALPSRNFLCLPHSTVTTGSPAFQRATLKSWVGPGDEATQQPRHHVNKRVRLLLSWIACSGLTAPILTFNPGVWLITSKVKNKKNARTGTYVARLYTRYRIWTRGYNIRTDHGPGKYYYFLRNISPFITTQIRLFVWSWSWSQRCGRTVLV